MSRRRALLVVVAAVVVGAGVWLALRGGGGGSRRGAPIERGVVLPPGARAGNAAARGLVVMPDGRVVAGVDALGGAPPALQRIAADGSDTAPPAKLALDELTAIAAAPGGRVVALGTRGGREAVVRVDVNGMPDPGFGDGGVADGGAARPRAVAVAGDGRVAVAADTPQGEIEVTRLTASGRPDGGSLRVAGPRPRASAAGIAWSRDGAALLVGGAALTDGGASGAPFLARVDARTAAVTIHTARTSLTTTTWTALAALPDGGAVLAGSGRRRDGRSVIAAVRFGADGTVDAAFGDAGVATATAGSGDAYAAAAIPAAAPGGVVVAASAQAGARPRAELVRLTPDGRAAPGSGDAGAPGRAGALAQDPRGCTALLASAWSEGMQRLTLTCLRPPSGG